ncbi:Teichoic acids export ATP-binding protein TagH [Legionella massiliensis]|uniref:Teichoic acids export ATP-binding protein TagH n=1 Tax=Legionella massiliensis TaxID=1034943 RepID=A0A078KT51_9GAMM|nr:ABC transporter ATP-binding protein [Legionella massiliensis]CDZ76246.1 Teichoic acids export ATP-binding protein TagH [Legionella massiliensis]CEE11984.1 Teichoic acids export ATP-binding protein TagH [Legionella massiliensis]
MSLLRINNLGKSYRTYRSEWLRFASWFNLPVKPQEEHWVLRGINFEVQPGEAIGLVGQNGAGKSTLLKMITGTLQPTEGTIERNGRIAAILELGMGFSLERTGRQNARHVAGLMGCNLNEIDKLIANIETFAELGSYFDEPMRVYSSGMQMRLAFAVATSSRPDILIVDEALAVGDSYFQHKCINRIREFQQEGTSLLLVSHSPETIRALCQRGIMLANGAIAKMGEATSVMDFYMANQVSRMEAKTSVQPQITETTTQLDTRDSKAVLASKTIGGVNVEIIGETQIIHTGDHISIRVTAAFDNDYVDPHIGIGIRTKLGIMVYEANTYTLQYPTRPVSAGEKLSVRFKFHCRLGPGTYELMVGVANKGYDRGLFEQALFFDQSFLIFEVVEGSHFSWSGIYDIQPELELDT